MLIALSDDFWVHVVTGAVAIALACIQAYSLRLQVRLKEQITNVHDEMNSMKDALIQQKGESEFAKGKLAGASEQRQQSDL